MLLSLIRHGEVNGRAQVLRGRSDDELTKHGEQQMRDIVATLHTDITAIACSPLRRCHIFAQAFSQQRDLPLHVINELREIDFGEWENLTLAEAETRDPDCFRMFKQQTELWQPPGGERYAAFRERIREILPQIRNINTSHLLVITHGGVIRALLAEYLQLSPTSAAHIGIPLAGLAQLWIDEQGVGSLLRLNWLGEPC
jgi:alpha-ribazole phosphatase